jgi:AraC-like DNA-binding protein
MEIRNIGVNATGSIGRHDHRDEGVHEFHYFLDGSGTFTNAGETYPVRPGSIFLSAPTDVHQADEDPGGPRMIVYNLSFLAQDPGDRDFAALLTSHFFPVATRSIGKGYGLLFEDLRRKTASEDLLFRLSAHHRFLAFVYEILGGQTRDHPPRGQLYVDEALRTMQSSIAGSLNLDALAAHLGIEKSYFIRVFKQVTGMPPLRYFLGMKMDAAQNSLRDPDKTVRQVAAELGYEDEFYFSRVFKSVTGRSPQTFRALR